jgi:hypothetical protein
MTQRHSQQQRNQLLQQCSAAGRLELRQVVGKTTLALDQNNG